MKKQKTFKEVTDQIEQILEPMYEMSKAFSIKNRRIDVCAWVENPMGANNQYFKYYDCSTIPSATKVARIRLDRPEYVGGNHRERNLQKWILTTKEKQELVDILMGPSDEFDGLNRWQDIIITYNKDNFNLTTRDILAGDFSRAQRDPKMSDKIQPLPLDYPMPNYMELQ